jgi:hypothetical protein
MRISSLVIAALLAGCGPRAPDVELSPLALDEPAPAPELVREARGARIGGADLFQASRVRRLDERVWVLDTGNDRLVRFDSALARADAFGREGEGPGELQFAMDMVVEGSRLVVAEAGNGRVSVFDSAGSFVATRPAPTGSQYLAVVGSALFTPLGLDGFYAQRIDDGRARHGAIPAAVTRLARSDPRTYLPAGPFLAAPPEGPLYVLDPSVLALAAYDTSGALLDVRLLPDPFRTRLLERRRKEMEEWGAGADGFVSVPATKQISIDDRGRLLVPFTLPDHWGLLIDPTTWSARPLPLPEDACARDILRTASDASLAGERLYVLSQDRLYEFAVRGWSAAGDAPLALGPTGRPRLVLFSDYECAACALLEREAGAELRSWAAAGRMRLELRHFPLPAHRRAPRASAWATCAARAGRCTLRCSRARIGAAPDRAVARWLASRTRSASTAPWKRARERTPSRKSSRATSRSDAPWAWPRCRPCSSTGARSRRSGRARSCARSRTRCAESSSPLPLAGRGRQLRAHGRPRSRPPSRPGAARARARSADRRAQRSAVRDPRVAGRAR